MSRTMNSNLYKYKGEELKLAPFELWCQLCGNTYKRYFVENEPIPTKLSCTTPDCVGDMDRYILKTPFRARRLEFYNIKIKLLHEYAIDPTDLKNMDLGELKVLVKKKSEKRSKPEPQIQDQSMTV